MCWSKLTNSELQAMRKLLMLDVVEAAELIGNVSARSWQRWEDGTRTVPSDIDMEIYALIQMRNDKVGELTEKQIKLEAKGKTLKMKYYHMFDDYIADFKKANKIDWRIHQAAVSFVFSEGGEVELE